MLDIKMQASTEIITIALYRITYIERRKNC